MATQISKTLRRLLTVAVTLLILLGPEVAAVLADKPAVAGTLRDEPRISQEDVYSCDFGTELSKQWKTIGGTWERKDGSLTRTDPRPADPSKAIVIIGDNRAVVSRDVSIIAKLRLDSSRDGDWARAGISVCSDPMTAHGLNLVLHSGRLQYVHDYVVWGPFVDFPCRVGTWYWIKLSKKDAELKGKAWQDGDPEPADWMVRWEIPDPSVTGYPALVAGAGGPGEDTCPVSFDRCAVLIGDVSFRYYTKKSTWRETMAASREALARQEIALAAEAPDQAGNSLLRTGLWDLLGSDFSDPALLRQMAAEQEDKIWTRDWPFGRVDVLAERYANATRAGLSARAHELAKNARTAGDLESISRLYHRSKEIEGVLARWKDANLQSLRLAVEDLIQTHGSAYAGGPQYLERIAQFEQTVRDAREGGDSVDFQRFYEAVKQFEVMRAEALLANPLLDFDRLLVVKRKDARAYSPMPSFAIPPFSSGPSHLLNGLPLNYQGNGVLRQIPIDNEIAVLSPLRPEGELTTLYRPEKSVFAGDVTLHFDADRLLFSSIGSHDRFQIFEVGVDGNNLRQVTRGEEHDVDNYDSCYLADDRILFGSSACFQSVPCERRHDEVANFCVMNGDGSGVRRLCFDQDHNFYPSMLSDGRVLYTRWEYTDISHAFSARMFTMNPDGTEQRAYYASSSYWPNRIFYAKPIPDHPTKFVGVITGHHGTARAGEVVLFDVARGRRLAEGAVQRIPGWGKKVEAILEDNLVDDSWPKFLHPYPLSDKYFLVSCQPTSQSPWGVYLVDVFDNMILLHEDEGWLLFEPVPLRKTPRPRVIPDRIDPDTREATVYLSDVYAGEGLKGIPRGTVKKLRLFTYHFNYFGTSGIEDYVGMDGPWDVRRVLGTVPVTEDGSAYFVVPANTPIAVQPLDSEGKALQLMRSWFTAMPGEAVACVGCHERVNSAPPERRPLALAGAPSRIERWYGPVRGFSWDREVQPVLDQFCVGCHDGRPQADGGAAPDLRHAAPRKMPHSDALFPPSFYALRRFVRSPGLEGSPSVLPVADYHADTSPLVRMLRKGHRNVRLDEEAWDRLVTWLDMNAPAYGTWLEIPSVSGKLAVRECRDRRIESQRRYGGIDEDPEAIPDTPPDRVTPVMPPEVVPANRIQVADWPFPAEEAKRRQAEAGAPTEMEIDLGPGCKMQLVLIPAGNFVLGGSAAYADERPLSKATIDRPFWIGKFEVTNEQYERFDPEQQSGLEPMLWLKWSWEDYVSLDQPRQPVCRVSWNEATAFCHWLSQQTGRTFALPSESQWEWACRAGTDTPLNFGPRHADSASFANLADASLHNFTEWPRTTPFSRLELVRQFHAVDPVDDKQRVSAEAGSYLHNRWGLHDMHGNVSEWTSSAYLPYPFRGDDPRHTDPDTRRVVRGGSWYDRADLARSGCRTSYWPWQRIFDVGFRVLCEAE
ncbi:MAG: SUMF1/EgtB/PvdO family nonheme iron enzyme [Pirellulaceae bacterium]|nr:SUMF1/EgtB/PvdO family nonheme iron enzyme [Pirellulaceae bacterium]